MSNRAFTQQLMSVQSNMLSFAYMLTSDRKAAHALVQDATLCALDREAHYHDSIPFKSWVFGMMRNIFAAEYKSKSYTADNSDSLYSLGLDLTGEYPQETYDVEAITEAVDTMEHEGRVSFSMYVCGYSDHEIAEHLGNTVGAVKSCLRKAWKVLRG